MNDNAGNWELMVLPVDFRVDGEPVSSPTIVMRRGPLGVFCREYNNSPRGWHEGRVSIFHVPTSLCIGDAKSGATAMRVVDELLQWESAWLQENYRRDLPPLRPRIVATFERLGASFRSGGGSPKSLARPA